MSLFVNFEWELKVPLACNFVDRFAQLIAIGLVDFVDFFADQSIIKHS